MVYDSLFLLEASWKNESSFERQGLEEKRLAQYQLLDTRKEGKERRRREGDREGGIQREKKLSIVANNMPIL